MDTRYQFFFSIFLTLLCQYACADVYKYQDASGDWHFTDKATGKNKEKAGVTKARPKKHKSNTNIAQKLEKHYTPETAIERSTLSVVKVKTNMGSGSGFFISENGYLITNKHVVRPAKFRQDKSDKAFAKTERRFNEQKKRNANYRKRLKNRKFYLEKSKAKLSLYSGEVHANEKQKYQIRLQEYRSDKRSFERNEREFKQKLQDFKRAKTKKNLDFANSNLARHFKIYLKDNTELVAQLVKISDKHDLALLKVDGYTMPYIKFPKAKKARQGHSVYAIGSPLGMKDHMTSGIVTSLKKYRIITDAKIFPGNSGGPLVNEEGFVLGVNTQKLVRHGKTALGEGFGIAITKTAIEEEFADAIAAKDPKQSEKAQKKEAAVLSAEEEKSMRMIEDIMKQYRQGAKSQSDS